ncbi:IS66 family insertion sequence element accessory protein TnpB, partial [Escherichia coli]
MIPLPSGTKIWLVAGITDMRNGFNGLAAKVQTALKDDPMSGHVFIFRGRSGSQVKLLWSTGDGLCLLNRPGFPGEYFICELRLPDHYFRWKHNKLFLLLPEEYGPAFP